MENRSGRSWLVAGILGAALGIYFMNRIDGTPMQRRMTYARRRWMRSLGNGYQNGRQMISRRLEAMLR
jgi:hypothetical protein